jgi:two-component system sensor histidine kinase YesM
MNAIAKLLSKTTVGQKLTAIIVLLTVIPAVVIGVLGFSFYAGGLRDRLAEGITRDIGNSSGHIAEKLDTLESYSKSISYDYTLERAGRAIGSDPGMYDVYYVDLSRYIRDKFYLRQDCKMAAFSFCAFPERKIFTSTESSSQQGSYLNDENARALAFANMLGTEPGYMVEGGKDVYLVRNLYDHLTFKRFGVLVLKLDMNYMLSEFLDKPEWKQGLYVELNGNRLDLGNSYPEAFSSRAAALITNSAPGGNAYTAMQGQSVVYGLQKPGRAELGYAISISTSTLMSDYNRALRNIIFALLCTIAPISLLLVLLYRSIMVPVRRLTESMHSLKDGQLGVQIDLKRGDEFGYMVDSFNSMSGQIKHLFEYAYKEELARKDALIMALQSQINPHFLYNTLELVNWQARLSGNEEISRVIESLGTILDAGMDRMGERTIPFLQELRHVDAYIFILQKRFGQKIGFKREIDESLLDVKVPVLMLQPIIENAILHGLEPAGGGTVTVRARADGGRMIIEVENDGEDIKPERLETLRALLSSEPSGETGFTRLGLKNVHERIRLIFGAEYGLAIDGREGGGVIVEITMPIKTA